MSTRRSKKNVAAESESDKEVGLGKGNAELSSDEEESGKTMEDSQESSTKPKIGRRLLRSKGKNTGKEDKKNTSKHDNEDDSEQEATEQEKQDEEIPDKVSPPRKRKRDFLDPPLTIEGKRKPKKNPRFVDSDDEEAKDIEDIEVSDEEDDYVVENEDDDDDDYDIVEEAPKGRRKSYSAKRKALDELQLFISKKKSRKSDEKFDSEDESSASESGKDQEHSKMAARSIKQYTKKRGIVHVKKLVPGASEGELEVLTYNEEQDDEDSNEKPGKDSTDNLSPDKVTRTYSGPTKQLASVTKSDGRKYMILDKATIQGMMEKGLIQTINKDGGGQQNLSYKAVLPKSGPSILRRVAAPIVHLKSQAGKADSASGTVPVRILPKSTGTPVTIRSSATSSATSLTESQLAGVNVQIPTSGAMQVTGSGVKQVTAPVFLKNPVSGASNMQVVSIPANILNQIQKGGSVLSLSVAKGSTGDKTILHTTTATSSNSKGTVLVSSDLKPVATESDPDNPDLAENESESGDDDKSKSENYGVPTGVCRVLKSMKMYQYVDKGEESGSKGLPTSGKNSHNVRWVAVPNKAADLKAEDVGKLQRCIPPVLPIHVPPIASTIESPELQKSKKGLRRILKEMKVQHRRLIGKHRTRYSRLQKKFNELEKDFQEVEDVGTAQQIVRDCKKYLTPEHSLFMESQMFWKNLQGKGNRYSKRFLLLMMDLYHKSPAGYRYLKTVFTLPSIKTLMKLENLGFSSQNQKLEENPHEGNEGEEIQEDGGLRNANGESNDSNHELPVIIKREITVTTEGDSLSLPVDNKDWFKSGMMLSESVPSTSGQTVFMTSSHKDTLAGRKPEDGIEVEEEGEDSTEHANSDNEGPSMPTFDTLSKKVVVVPDNDSISKQEITIQWDESWGSL